MDVRQFLKGNGQISLALGDVGVVSKCSECQKLLRNRYYYKILLNSVISLHHVTIIMIIMIRIQNLFFLKLFMSSLNLLHCIYYTSTCSFEHSCRRKSIPGQSIPLNLSTGRQTWVVLYGDSQPSHLNTCHIALLFIMFLNSEFLMIFPFLP